MDIRIPLESLTKTAVPKKESDFLEKYWLKALLRASVETNWDTQYYDVFPNAEEEEN